MMPNRLLDRWHTGRSRLCSGPPVCDGFDVLQSVGSDGLHIEDRDPRVAVSVHAILHIAGVADQRRARDERVRHERGCALAVAPKVGILYLLRFLAIAVPL